MKFLRYLPGASLMAWMAAVSLAAQVPPADSFDPGVNGPVFALAVQPDGKVLVGGSFTMLGGQPRENIGRVNPDGTLDRDFDPGANDVVYALVVQRDGRVLVGGRFTELAGETRVGIGRLNSDGSLDAEFTHDAGGIGVVRTMVAQPDGKVLVGGGFSSLGGTPHFSLGRLNPDGSADPGFNAGANGEVQALAVQPDGKILVGGWYSRLGNHDRSRIGRLHPDGAVDMGFDPGANDRVTALAVQPDGRILVGGWFTTLGGEPRDGIGRLHPDGTVENSFNPGASPPGPVGLALQADGKVLVGGSFASLGGSVRHGMGRLHPDGSLDDSFSPAPVGTVRSLAIQKDGKVLAGGNISRLGGERRNYLGRIHNTDPATQSLTVEASRLAWMRGDSSPEVSHVTFDHSVDGGNWTDLGTGARVEDGWELTAVAAPEGGSIRARGFVEGPSGGWIVETVLGPPVILTQPVEQAVTFGAMATLRVFADGSPPLSYQWSKDGVALADDDNISGTTTATLRVSEASPGDLGDYQVVVSNGDGSLTSRSARLVASDPAIVAQPQSAFLKAGESVAFRVTAVGTPVLDFQWSKDGVALAGATEPELHLATIRGSDAGSYQVVVRNDLAAVTSSVARLSVNLAVLDDSFTPVLDAAPYRPQVNTLAVQQDGKILVGGSFATLDGESRRSIGRLNPDGTLDNSFNPRANGSVVALAMQPDGKILVGGWFSMLGGHNRHRIGRLNPDGTLDVDFNPTSEHLGDRVNSLFVQPDGKILVGGTFTLLGGDTRDHLARINSDGSPDVDFKPSPNGEILTLGMQLDGKIIVGGRFTWIGDRPRKNIARLHPDGSVDTNFNPAPNGLVRTVTVQPDGRIVLGGSFTSLDDESRRYLTRLNADGTPDSSFNPSPDAPVIALALQGDGGVLVGYGRAKGIVPATSIGRLHADGTPDTSFDTQTGGYVASLTVHPGGKVLVCGEFDTPDRSSNLLGRFHETHPIDETLTFETDTLTWSRRGPGPAFWRTTFEYSTDGETWTPLGQGAAIEGGWELGGVLFPADGTVRARGYVAGDSAGSGWFGESTIPVSRSFAFLTPTAGFNDGRFGFHFTGPSGQEVTIESSRDFRTWIPVWTNTFDGSPLSWTDPDPDAPPFRFYRLRH